MSRQDRNDFLGALVVVMFLFAIICICAGLR